MSNVYQNSDQDIHQPTALRN